VKWVTLCVFISIFAGHFLYATRDVSISDDSDDDVIWATYKFEQPEESRLNRYIGPGEYWLGLAYGLAGAFAAFSFLRAIKMRREALASSAGGIALGGLLWAGVCFFVGCCGSPMLSIYLGLLGPKFLGVTKPLTFGLTLLSIVVGSAWMFRRAEKVKT